MEIEVEVFRPNFEKRGGLVTVVVVEEKVSIPIMVACTNEEGYLESLEKGVVVLYSRRRKTRWVKGEENGNTMKIRRVYIDCDGDAVVFQIIPQKGKRCHTGARSCFFRDVDSQLYEAPEMGHREQLSRFRVKVHADLLQKGRLC